MVITNVVSNLAKFPTASLKKMTEWFPASGSEENENHYSYPVRVASRLLGIPKSTVRYVVRAMERCNFQPAETAEKARATSNRKPAEEDNDLQDAPLKDDSYVDPSDMAMQNIVTVALGCAAEGRSGLEFEREMKRCRNLGVDCGNSLHGRKIFEESIFTAAMISRNINREEWSIPLGSLGIPSDVSLAVDGVSLGYGKCPRHDTLLVIVAVLVGPDGCLMTPLAASPTIGLGQHGGDALSDLTLSSIRPHFKLSDLKARLASISGDGAMVQGGEDSRHPSTKAAEKIFQRVYGFKQSALVDWDEFHRSDMAYSRAVGASKPMKEIYDMHAVLDSLFNIAEGKALFRFVAALLDDKKTLATIRGNSTRKVGHSVWLASHLVSSYQAISLGLHARLAWKRQGHGTATLGTVTSVCRRFSDLSFVAFLLLASDLARPVHQHAMTVQTKCEAWRTKRADDALLADFEKISSGIQEIRTAVLVVTICLQHMHGSDIASALAVAILQCFMFWL